MIFGDKFVQTLGSPVGLLANERCEWLVSWAFVGHPPSEASRGQLYIIVIGGVPLCPGEHRT